MVVKPSGIDSCHRALGIRSLSGCCGHGDYVTGMGATDGATAPPEGGNVDAAHGPNTLGDTRAVMIEGPSREALELVEVAPAKE